MLSPCSERYRRVVLGLEALESIEAANNLLGLAAPLAGFAPHDAAAYSAVTPGLDRPGSTREANAPASQDDASFDALFVRVAATPAWTQENTSLVGADASHAADEPILPRRNETSEGENEPPAETAAPRGAHDSGMNSSAPNLGSGNSMAGVGSGVGVSTSGNAGVGGGGTGAVGGASNGSGNQLASLGNQGVFSGSANNGTPASGPSLRSSPTPSANSTPPTAPAITPPTNPTTPTQSASKPEAAASPSTPPVLGPQILPTVQFHPQSGVWNDETSGGTIQFAVSLSAASTQTVTVHYATSNGPAQAGKDYTATSGILTFPPGETVESFTVPVFDDKAVKEVTPEIFFAKLSNPTNATLGNPRTGIGYIKEDSDGGTNIPVAYFVAHNCNCGDTNEPGTVVVVVPLSTGPTPPSTSGNPVRYADGTVIIAESDLHSDGFGFPWGQTRSWTNGTGYTTGSVNGNGWVDTQMPHILQADGSTSNTIVEIGNGSTAGYYDLVNGSYQGRYADPSLLSYNSGNDTYTITDGEGNQTIFNGFGTTWLAAQRGEFAKYIAADGIAMSVTSYTSDGHIGEV
jgi:hypothetical protein